MRSIALMTAIIFFGSIISCWVVEKLIRNQGVINWPFVVLFSIIMPLFFVLGAKYKERVFQSQHDD